MSGSPASSIQTRTLLWSSPRQVPMAHNLRFRKENLQIPEKVNESRFLLSCHGVARLALLIEPSLIADADRASIIRSGMSTHLQQLTVLRHRQSKEICNPVCSDWRCEDTIFRRRKQMPSLTFTICLLLIHDTFTFNKNHSNGRYQQGKYRL